MLSFGWFCPYGSFNTAIWREYEWHIRTCHSLPFFFGQFLFCYHTFLILIGLLTGLGAHLDSLSWAKEMCIVNRIKQMEIPWQLCYPMHNIDWAIGAACRDLPEWFLHTGLFKQILFIKKDHCVQLICNMMSFRATHRHRSENPLQCDFYCFYLQWEQRKRSHFQPRIGQWDMMEYRL